MSQGRSGLLHVTTGAGKTLAVWLGALERFVPLDQEMEKRDGSQDAAKFPCSQKAASQKRQCSPFIDCPLADAHACAGSRYAARTA